MTDLLQAALEWAELGVAVFPCNGKKQPLTKHGFKDATSDPDKVPDLFGFFGDNTKMIGAAMGKVSGLVAFDFDLYRGEEIRTYMDQLIHEGLLPDSRTHTTPSGGVHVIYEYSADVKTTRPVPGLDVQSDGTYIIVPPSPGYEVTHTGLRKVPKKLVELLKKTHDSQPHLTIDELKLKIITGASFHDALRTLAAKLSKVGVPPVGVVQELREVLSSSVAADVNNKRHARWLKMMADEGGELSRLIQSGYEKYNPNYASAKMRESVDDSKAEIAAKLFGGKEEAKKYDSEEWPFAGEGYFADEDHDLLDQTYVMHPFFAENETTVLFAEPKMGKTAWNVTASLHIACGLNYGPSLKVTEARPCLYYALEGSRAIKLRISAWRKYMKELGTELPEKIPMFVVERSRNFLKEKDREEACNQIIAANNYAIKHHGKPLGVISLDTLTKAMSSGDQNSVEDTSALFELVNLLREGGVVASIVFVHHKARTGGVRGSTNIEAEPDVLLDVSKGRVDATDIEVRVARARSIEEGGVYTFYTETVGLGVTKQGINLSSFVVMPKDVALAASGSLVKAKWYADFMNIIITMGHGQHDLVPVYNALIAAGMAPTNSKGAPLHVTGGEIQKMFMDNIGEKGVSFNGLGVNLGYNKENKINKIIVGSG